MIFADLTLGEGRVYSERRHDSRKLARSAVAECRGYLRQLQQGERLVAVDFPGLDFAVRLGLPEHFPEAPGNDRFFCVGAVGSIPFQYNLLLPAGVDPNEARFALSTLYALSFGGQQQASAAPHELEEMIEPWREKAPALFTALLALPGLSAHLVVVASDFATCFAAAWLEAQEG